MQMTIRSTAKIVTIKVGGVDVPARIWKGETSAGIPVYCWVTLIGVPVEADQTRFEQELQALDTLLVDADGIPTMLTLNVREMDGLEAS